MASSAITPKIIAISSADLESDYGSDFSPEEEAIVAKLLAQTAVEDNPIVNDVEYHGAKHTLRIPRAVRSAVPSEGVLLHAVRAAEKISEQINEVISGDVAYPDCRFTLFVFIVYCVSD